MIVNSSGCISSFRIHKIKFLAFSTSASIRPHKKAVKKNEAEGAKEKQLLPKLGYILSL
jgi:hypothetical protein